MAPGLRALDHGGRLKGEDRRAKLGSQRSAYVAATRTVVRRRALHSASSQRIRRACIRDMTSTIMLPVVGCVPSRVQACLMATERDAGVLSRSHGLAKPSVSEWEAGEPVMHQHRDHPIALGTPPLHVSVAPNTRAHGRCVARIKHAQSTRSGRGCITQRSDPDGACQSEHCAGPAMNHVPWHCALTMGGCV